MPLPPTLYRSMMSTFLPPGGSLCSLPTTRGADCQKERIIGHVAVKPGKHADVGEVAKPNTNYGMLPILVERHSLYGNKTRFRFLLDVVQHGPSPACPGATR